MRMRWIAFVLGIVLMLLAFWKFDFLKSESTVAMSSQISTTTTTTTTLSLQSGESETAATTPKITSQIRLENYLKAADPEADWRVHRTSTGLVTSLSGGMLKENLSSESEALVFAQKLAPMIGLDPEQIQSSSNQLPRNPDNISYKFDQVYDGYSVFGGEMTVFAKANDGSVYYVANEAQPLSDVDTRIAYNLEAAQKMVLEKYNQRKIKIENSSEKPFIVITESPRGVLCWQLQVRFGLPRIEKRLLLISVRDLSVVRNIDLMVRN